MKKNLYGYVSDIIKDVSYSSVLKLIEQGRKQKLEMNPSSAFTQRRYSPSSPHTRRKIHLCECLEFKLPIKITQSVSSFTIYTPGCFIIFTQGTKR